MTDKNGKNDTEYKNKFPLSDYVVETLRSIGLLPDDYDLEVEVIDVSLPSEEYVRKMVDPVMRVRSYMDLLSSRIRVGELLEKAVKDHYTTTAVAAYEKMRLQRAIDRIYLEVDEEDKPRINGKNPETRRAQLREALEFEHRRSEHADQRTLKTRRNLEEVQARLSTVKDAIRITELIDAAMRDVAATLEVQDDEQSDSGAAG